MKLAIYYLACLALFGATMNLAEAKASGTADGLDLNENPATSGNLRQRKLRTWECYTTWSGSNSEADSSRCNSDNECISWGGEACAASKTDALNLIKACGFGDRGMLAELYHKVSWSKGLKISSYCHDFNVSPHHHLNPATGFMELQLGLPLLLGR